MVFANYFILFVSLASKHHSNFGSIYVTQQTFLSRMEKKVWHLLDLEKYQFLKIDFFSYKITSCTEISVLHQKSGAKFSDGSVDQYISHDGNYLTRSKSLIVFYNEHNVVVSQSIQKSTSENILCFIEFCVACPINISAFLIFFIFFSWRVNMGYATIKNEVECSLWEWSSHWQDCFTYWLSGKLFMVPFLNTGYLLSAGNTVSFTSP